MRCLVTGGAGFIGTNLVRRLLERGDSVRVLDDFSTGHRRNLADLLDRIELVDGDIRHPAVVRAAVDGVDVVFHQAALPSVPRSIDDPIATHDVGGIGVLNVLQAARDCGAGRVIFASSSSVYGDAVTLPEHEALPPAPLSPYAVSKLAGEQYCQVFFRLYGLETVSLRYFNVFGPWQDPAGRYTAAVPAFIGAMRRGERPVIFGDGEQSRDFTYIDDIVEANLLAAGAESGVAGEVFNAAGGERVTLNRLVRLLNRELGTSLEPLYMAPRPGDVRHTFAAIGKFSDAVGYRPGVRFAEGIGRTVAWHVGRATDGASRIGKHTNPVGNHE